MIGGSPTSGKSTLAEAVAKHLNIPWISTDQIRSLLRVYAKPEEHPWLFDTEEMTAEQFFAKYTPKEIAQRELKQADSVWPAVKLMIETDYTWENGFVVEGVNIVPRLVHKDFDGNDNVKTVFLIDEDAKNIEQVVHTRGLWDDADKYPETVKKLEVGWVLEFSKLLREEAAAFGYKCIDVRKQDDDLDLVLKAWGVS